MQSIIDDPIFRSEFDETDTAEHAQLVISSSSHTHTHTY